MPTLSSDGPGRYMEYSEAEEQERFWRFKRDHPEEFYPMKRVKRPVGAKEPEPRPLNYPAKHLINPKQTDVE